jgi:uncharacterized protein YgiM (DUF1202 family)
MYAFKTGYLGEFKMLTQRILFLVLGIAIITSLCPAAEKASPAIRTTTRAATPAKPEMPYVAEVIGTDVYVRSGPSTAYYFCSKLNEPTRVIVVGQTYGWSKIVPPEGSFSWISKNFVRVDPDNPTIGFVTGDNDIPVRVWAGSNYEVPMRSSTEQTKLNRGDIVTIIQKQDQGDYYKIVSPTGAYLWVSSQYLKYVGAVPKAESSKLPPKPQDEINIQTKPKAETPKVEEVEKTINVTKPEKTVVEPKVPSTTEDKKIKQCQAIEEKIKTEISKPIAEQNYEIIKKDLKPIAEDQKAGKAQLYAKYLLDRIAGIELAMFASDELKRQDTELSRIRAKIKKARDELLAEIPPLDKFVITGTLKPSNIFTARVRQKRYLIVNDTGKIQCYAIPASKSTDAAVQKLINRKVGLVGKVTSDPKSPVSLIEFTQAVEL